ncbi:MAG: UDP-N-acetylmuramoyl-tripeptide--D-alanyl-D-alanine ligase [bacterium]|nr:UDP-N-acetylmuramoyl-tripeptide--D-alanyl-D-alanine ligase [bacterium]
MQILFFFVLIWVGYASIHLIYLFQIKEYRFDRFISTIKEFGIRKILYTLDVKRPALTVRNILLVLIVGMMLVMISYAGFVNPLAVTIVTFIGPFAPLSALLFVGIGVIITSIPAHFYRLSIIKRAKAKMKQSKAVVIGVTGSYGKTSVKEYLHHILSSKYKVAKTDKNMNADVGIALSILNNVTSETEYFIAEFGAYKRGEVRTSAQFVPIHHAILTPLGNQHLDLYGSRQAIIDEETYILTQVPAEGRIYIYEGAPSMQPLVGKKILYGSSNDADIIATQMHLTSLQTTATVTYKGTTLIIKTRLLGEHSIQNLLPAIACALDLGMNEKQIEEVISSIKPITGKLSTHPGPKESIVLYDGLTANIDGFIAALRTMSLFPQQKKMIITQGVIELGVEKRESYQRVLEEIKKYDTTVFTTDELWGQLSVEKNVFTFNDVSSLIRDVLSRANHDTLILIEGRFAPSIINQLI